MFPGVLLSVAATAIADEMQAGQLIAFVHPAEPLLQLLLPAATMVGTAAFRSWSIELLIAGV